MDRNPWVSALIISLNLMIYVSGEMAKPENVNLQIWEGNVTVTWDPPLENPDCLYQVQTNDYSVTPVVWRNLTNCSLLTTTVCNIGLLPSDSRFHVRVGALMPQGYFSWSIKRLINVRRSKLYPPTFSLLSTSFSVQVKVHRKHLKEIFPYGLEYTTYLRPKGQNQTKSDDDTDGDGKIEFGALQPLQIYCVHVEVKSQSGASNISSEQCIQIPLDVTLIICFVFPGLLGFMAVLTLFACYFLRRPRKMPSALKPVVNSWEPMSIGSVHVETVTDKGWLLIISKKEENRHISEDKIEFAEEEKDRRESLDSGVNIDQLHSSVSDIKEAIQTAIQEDSGCGSLKGTEGSGCVRSDTRDFFSLDEISHDGRNEGREDSGLGLSNQEVSDSLEGEDSGLLSKVVVGDGYRSQSPSSMDVKNEASRPYNMDTNMTAPSGGYKSDQVTCICSDHEYCPSCKSKRCLETPVPKIFSQTIDDTDKICSSYSNYRKNNLFQDLNLLVIEDTESVFPESDMNTETSPFLLSCPLLMQSGENKDCILDTNSFTLDDVKLAFF